MLLFSTIVFSVLTPITVGVINLITTPFNIYFKQRLEDKVQKLYVQNKDVKSVCIVGSYGKTTVRNYLNEVLKYNFRVLTPSGNINTGAGLALWFSENLHVKFDILLFETDGYKAGEVGEAAKLFQPDFVVVTAIGDQHMMRLKTRENLARTLLEAVKHSKPTAQVIMDMKTHQDFEKLLGTDFVSETIADRKTVIIENSEESGKEISRIIALDLGADKSLVEDSIKNLQAPDRRGNIMKMHGFDVIDQSYNISWRTANKAIVNARKLADSQNKKLAVIAAGIPELGKINDQGNIMLGEDMDVNCDRIYLIKSILYKEIYNEGIVLKKKVSLVADLNEAWKQIKSDLSPDEYIILFFPELDDLYY
jgi:UDP-N-acetylmuramoyl-tripeptide--D-alanyl-D-alanine ligase